MKTQLRALLTGFFTETNTYVAEGTIASFSRTPGDDILKQNRGVNSTLGAYPFTRSMVTRNGQATAYVCQDFACRLPTTSIDQMLKSLQQNIGS